MEERSRACVPFSLIDGAGETLNGEGGTIVMVWFVTSLVGATDRAQYESISECCNVCQNNNREHI